MLIVHKRVTHLIKQARINFSGLLWHQSVNVDGNSLKTPAVVAKPQSLRTV
jgi:hypothetical protein